MATLTYNGYLEQLGLKMEEGKSVINLNYVDKQLDIEDEYLYGLVTATTREKLLPVVSIGVVRCIFWSAVQLFGIETTKKALETGGWIFSWLRAKQLLDERKISNLDEFLDYLHYDFQNVGYGILTHRESNGKLYITFEESMTSCGMAKKGMDLCALECGRIVGGLSAIKDEKLTYKEVKCWGLGDNCCEIEVESTGEKPDTTNLERFSDILNLKKPDFNSYLKASDLEFEDERSIMLLDYKGNKRSGLVSPGRKKLPPVVSVSILRGLVDSLEFYFGHIAVCTVMGIAGEIFSMLTVHELIQKENLGGMPKKEKIKKFAEMTKERFEERGLGILDYSVEGEKVIVELSEAAGFGIFPERQRGRCEPFCAFEKRAMGSGLSIVTNKNNRYDSKVLEPSGEGVSARCIIVFEPIGT